MEPQPYALAMQRQMAAQIERTRPRYMVLVNSGNSWLVEKKSHRLIFDWADAFLRGYRPVGLLVLRLGAEGLFFQGDEARTRKPRSRNWCHVFERIE